MKKKLFHKLKVGLAALAILAMFAASSTSLGPQEASAQEPPPPNCGCLDLVLVVDDTGSMGLAINNVKAGLDSVVTAANAASGGDLRMGLVTFKDYIEVDQPLTAVIADLTNAVEALVAPSVSEVGALESGANEPEASDEAVRCAATGATLDPTGTVFMPKGQPLGSFRTECVKIIVLVTDATPGGFDDFYNEAPWAPPHDDVNAQEAANAAAAAGIKISSVLVDNGSIVTLSHPGGVEPDVMKAYADTTGGVFVKVPADGAGISAAITKIIESCGGSKAARTIGFWKSWSSCANSSGKERPVLDETLDLADPAGILIGDLLLLAGDCQKAVNLLNKSTINTGKKMASDPAFNLAAQLLAGKLNVAAGAGVSACAVSAINAAQDLLDAINFNGNTHGQMTPSQVSQANSLAQTLDLYNNNNLVCP